MSESKKQGLAERAIETKKQAARAVGLLAIRSLGLLVVPFPIGPLKRQIAYRFEKDGLLLFLAQPPFMLTCWFIMIGWLTTLGFWWNSLGYAQIPASTLTWPWIAAGLVTIAAMGANFHRVRFTIMVLTLVVFLLLLLAFELTSFIPAVYAVMGHVPIFGWIAGKLAAIPMAMEWGIPFVFSAALSIAFWLTAAWQRLNDRWSVAFNGNYLDHHNWQQKDVSYSKGAKTFVEQYDCLLKKWLFFGFGDVQVLSHDGAMVYHRIEGVFFAKTVAKTLRERFGTTDVTEVIGAIVQDHDRDSGAEGQHNPAAQVL